MGKYETGGLAANRKISHEAETILRGLNERLRILKNEEGSGGTLDNVSEGLKYTEICNELEKVRDFALTKLKELEGRYSESEISLYEIDAINRIARRIDVLVNSAVLVGLSHDRIDIIIDCIDEGIDRQRSFQKLLDFEEIETLEDLDNYIESSGCYDDELYDFGDDESEEKYIFDTDITGDFAFREEANRCDDNPDEDYDNDSYDFEKNMNFGDFD